MQWTGNSLHNRPATQPDPEPTPAEHDSSRPLVVVLGPTASGKTALAIQLAQVFDGEIVGADSRQIYRYMDIGTAKPTPAERAAVPHHLLDIADPDETITLAEYQRAAYQAIDAIHARDRLPLLVGGTGQYITAVIEGWNIPEVPPNPGLRAGLESFAEEQGARALHQRLSAVDPDAASRIDFRNVRRVIRALEVYLETGTPITILQRKTPPPYHALQIGLNLPRDSLYGRIDSRVEHMVAAGLLDEVRALLDRGYTWTCPAMSGLGYGQWRPFLSGEITLAQTIAAIQRDTHAYARRQYTWFNGHDTGIHWLDAPEEATQLVRNWLIKRQD